MKYVIAGGTGQLGGVLARAFRSRGHDVVIIARGTSDAARVVPWDGKSLGAWASEIHGADVVINLAGRTVNCRYTEENLRQMMDSRVDSTRAVGEAIASASRPPRAWLQMSTATIYAHRFDAPNDEHTGVIGGNEPDVPRYWARSIAIAKAWEATQAAANTPHTRRVALRTAMTMSPDRGGVFDVLLGMVRKGLGGPVGSGKQFVSWIHDRDFVRAIDFLADRDDLDGPFNLAAPEPLRQRDFMATLRREAGVRIGLPATAWMAEIGAFFLRTDTELLMKSRYVVPARLREAGFAFDFSDWTSAARDLLARHR